jgi:hypothetical protein
MEWISFFLPANKTSTVDIGSSFHNSPVPEGTDANLAHIGHFLCATFPAQSLDTCRTLAPPPDLLTPSALGVKRQTVRLCEMIDVQIPSADRANENRFSGNLRPHPT